MKNIFRMMLYHFCPCLFLCIIGLGIVFVRPIPLKIEKAVAGDLNLLQPDSHLSDNKVFNHNNKDEDPFSWVITFYQRYISPVDGLRCPMHPSCSQYAHQAISEKGAVGIMAVFDRLLRCGRDLDDYPLIFKKGSVFYYDPPIYKPVPPSNENIQ